MRTSSCVILLCLSCGVPASRCRTSALRNSLRANGKLLPEAFQDACALLSPILRQFQVPDLALRAGGGHAPVADRIGDSCFRKRLQPKQAAIANAAGFFVILIARPS